MTTGIGDTLFHFLRLRVERLAEFHDVDATLTKRRTDRGRRRRRSRRDLKLELACNFLSHLSPAFVMPAGLPGGCSLVVRFARPARAASPPTCLRRRRRAPRRSTPLARPAAISDQPFST